MTAYSPAAGAGFAPYPSGSAAFADRLLNAVLFFTMTLSSIVFIEPSPHDGLMFVLLIAAAAARVRFDPKLTPLLLLLFVWLVGGCISLMQNGSDLQKPIQYLGTSVYMGLAALLFACLASDGNLTRLAVLYRGYLVAALIATASGYIGFFHLLPGSNMFLALSDDQLSARVSATFKDPNVYGPFLVYPMAILTLQILTLRLTLFRVVTLGFLLGGLLLSFSRGAWIHFLLSAAIAAGISYVSAPTRKSRTRIVLFFLFAILVMAVLFAALMSIGSVREMFVERAKLFQPYDTAGSGGRFTLQELAVTQILENPLGMGPFGFSDMFGGQQHNVYMQGFLVYGWLGGAAFLAFIAVTLVLGLRYAFCRTPWQIYLVAAFGTYVGEIGESIIIDSDHWRHFFLVLGLVWGLSIATINWNYRNAAEFPAYDPLS